MVTPDALANPPAPRVVIISFDDGFEDFADTAWPILRDHGFCPIVYLPSGRMGGSDSWAGGNIPARPLMGWDRVEALATEGVCFGAHSISHPDLTTLDPETLEEEVTGSGQDITARLASPSGISHHLMARRTRACSAQVAQHYDTSVGTRLGVAKAGG